MVQQVIDRPVVGGTRLKMSYEEWRDWNIEGVKSEWVDGEAIVFMSTTILHARLMRFLSALLAQYVQFRQLGEVFTENVEMFIGGRVRVPDLLFVRADQLTRVGRTRLDGPADLAIELVSDDSVERDYDEKFKEYAAAGVTEYWAIDARDDIPAPRPPVFCHLVDDAYRPIPLDADGRLWSRAVRGFWFRPEWLRQDPLPNPWPLVALIAPEARETLAQLDAAEPERS